MKKKNNYPSNYFDSFLDFRKKEVDNYIQNNKTQKYVKQIFKNNYNQKDDWTNLLNIENIMYLSALNYDDLDLESIPKYKLLRDSILEKVIMLTVSYYCLANELELINGEYYLFNAINISIIFLPALYPIILYYI